MSSRGCVTEKDANQQSSRRTRCQHCRNGHLKCVHEGRSAACKPCRDRGLECIPPSSQPSPQTAQNQPQNCHVTKRRASSPESEEPRRKILRLQTNDLASPVTPDVSPITVADRPNSLPPWFSTPTSLEEPKLSSASDIPPAEPPQIPSSIDFILRLLQDDLFYQNANQRESDFRPCTSHNDVNTVDDSVVGQLRRQYDSLLTALYMQLLGCLRTFTGTETTAWETDLRQMLTLLVAWRPGSLYSQPTWATIGTPEGSNIGRGSVSMQEADVWYMTPSEFGELLSQNEPIRKCLIIREPQEAESSHEVIKQFLERLSLKFGSTSVEIQNLNGEKKRPSFVPSKQYVQTVSRSMEGMRNLTSRGPPLNLLNLHYKAVETTNTFTQSISKHPKRFDILDILCTRAESTLKEMTMDPKRPNYVPESNAGKAKRAPTLFGTQIDLQSCHEFGLFAQRGCFSGWHVDVLNGTYVKCVAGLKAWFIHQHPLTEAEKRAFSAHGPHWQPHPSRVKLIVLQPGDTLYMPAGELVPHAPITMSDCLMRGGMRWDTLRTRDILANIAWIVENNSVTNEPIPAQLVACWAELEKMVQSEPDIVEWMPPRSVATMKNGDAFVTGVADVSQNLMGGPPTTTNLSGASGTTTNLSAYFDAVTARMKAAMRCECAGKVCTEAKCRCKFNEASDYKCTAWCHPKTKNRDPRPCMY